MPVQNCLRIKIQIIKIKHRIDRLDQIPDHIDHTNLFHEIRHRIPSEFPLQLLIKGQIHASFLCKCNNILHSISIYYKANV